VAHLQSLLMAGALVSAAGVINTPIPAVLLNSLGSAAPTVINALGYVQSASGIWKQARSAYNASSSAFSSARRLLNDQGFSSPTKVKAPSALSRFRSAANSVISGLRHQRSNRSFVAFPARRRPTRRNLLRRRIRRRRYYRR